MIISNNPLVSNSYDNVKYVEGTYRDVLIQVRDLVFLGHGLVSHPLGASIGQIQSPIRSIIVTDDKTHDEYSIETISQSIEKYDLTMGERQAKYSSQEDYEMLDLELLKSTINELEKLEKIEER